MLILEFISHKLQDIQSNHPVIGLFLYWLAVYLLLDGLNAIFERYYPTDQGSTDRKEQR